MADPVTAAPPATEAAPDPNAQAAPPPTPTEPKPEPRRFKAKVNGREVDLAEDEVIEAGLSAAQIRRAANERWEASQRAMAEVAGFKEAFGKDPVAALRALSGQSKGFREAIERWLTEEFQLEQADPATKARVEAERRAADAERKASDLEQAQRYRDEQAALAQARQEIDRDFSEALEKVGLPRTTEAIRRMAQLGQRYNAMGAPLDALRLARLVKQDLVSEQVNGLAELDGEALLRSIHPDVLKKIRAAEVARVRATQTPAVVAQPKPQVVPQQGRRSRGENPNPHLLSREEWYRRQGIDPDRDL